MEQLKEVVREGFVVRFVSEVFKVYCLKLLKEKLLKIIEFCNYFIWKINFYFSLDVKKDFFLLEKMVVICENI